MTIQEFAENPQLKTQRCQDDGATIINGKLGHLYEYSDSELGVCFMLPATKEEPWGKWTPKMWGNLRRAGVAAGMTLRQNGDTEGCLSFDPSNQTQAKLAIKAVKARPKRQLSPEQVARQVANLAEFRSQTKQEGALAF